MILPIGGEKAQSMTNVVKRELKRIVDRPVVILVMVIMPIIITILFSSLFSEGVPRDLPVIVYDADHSALSRHLTRMIDASPAIRVAHIVSDEETGKNGIMSGQGYALVILPHHLERDVIRGDAPTVIEYYNNQFLVPASLIHKDLVTVAATISAGLDIRKREARGEMFAAARAHAEPIHTDYRTLFNPYLNYVYFLLNSLVPTMLQIFILMISVYALGSELKEGTAEEWAACAGGSTWKAVAGKLLPYTIIFVIMGLSLQIVLYSFFQFPFRGNLPFLGLAMICLVMSYQAIAILFVSITANLRLSLSFSAFYVVPAFAFVGITYPIFDMSVPGKIWGSLLPLTYYLRLLVDQTMRGTSIVTSLPYLAFILVFAVVIPPLTTPRLKHLMRHQRYWGKS